MLNFSVCLSKSLYMPVCLHISLSLSLSFSLSICGVGLADQGSRAQYRAIQVFSWDSESVPFPVEAHYPNYVSFIRNHYMRGSRKFCQRGSNLDNVFLVWWGGELSKYHYKRAVFGPPAKRHLNGVLLACRLWPKIESWLGSHDFKGIGTSIAKKPLYFCDFRGEVRTACLPSPLDPHMHFILVWVELTSCWFSSDLVYAPLNRKWTYLSWMIPLLFAQLCILEFLLG